MPRVKEIKSGPDRGCICFIQQPARHVSLDTSLLRSKVEIEWAMEWLGRRSEFIALEDALSKALVEHARVLERFSTSARYVDSGDLVASAAGVAVLHAKMTGARLILELFEKRASKSRLDHVMAAVTEKRGYQ